MMLFDSNNDFVLHFCISKNQDIMSICEQESVEYNTVHQDY